MHSTAAQERLDTFPFRTSDVPGLPGSARPMTLGVLLVLGVFVSALVLDFATARYSLAVQQRRSFYAANWSVLMCLLSSFALLAFVDVSKWMLVPECAGLWIGTMLGIRTKAEHPRP